MTYRVEKQAYSRGAWRVLDEHGQVYEERSITHPMNDLSPGPYLELFTNTRHGFCQTCGMRRRSGCSVTLNGWSAG